jgi:cell surface protein SprA
LSLNLLKFPIITGGCLLLLAASGSTTAYAQARDTIARRSDSTRFVNPFRPSFRLRDRYGDPFSNYTTHSPLFLKNPSSLQLDLQLDTGRRYNIYERLGPLNYRPASSMTFEEFQQQQSREMMRSYWQGRSRALDGESAVSSRNLIPKIYVSPVLDRIFGGSFVELIPRGFVTLDFGGQWQKIENPSIPIRQQRNGGFEFDQQISLNVTGKVGEKLAITTNFDNNNSFDFQNNMKVEYTGFKEDILKKLEIGNVSLPLNNSLITGAQNLFGVKAQMQFGKLFVTSLATTQRGKQSTINIPGSTNGTAQGRPFEIVGSAYDENRHFFLAQFFRDNFETWLRTLPQVNSSVNITRVEVYVLNRQNDTRTLRNVVAFQDMGEPRRIFNPTVTATDVPRSAARNGANNLFSLLTGVSTNATEVSQQLTTVGFRDGTDFELITSARKLETTEYTVNRQLGYITLQRRLQNDEALAVAFEYTFNGRAYKVGELTEDYANKTEEEVIFLKMLRPRKIAVRDRATNQILPTWDLMMKNIYNLNVNQVTQEGFQLRVIYRDDRTGIDNPQLQEGEVARTRQLIEVFGLDRLNPYNDPQPDGNFDFVRDVTVGVETGVIIFPFLEPFNNPLRDLFALEPNPSLGATLVQRYVYDTLYRTTRAEAELVATKNKFFLVGSFRSGSGKEIVIQGFNISPGSVKVFAGGTPLREGVDYAMDYTFGKVTLLNEGILSSGKDINITYEQQDPFAFQTRTLLGTRLDYKLNDDINIGSTLLYYNERALVSRNAIGQEPARNLQYGLDINLRKNSRLLTKMVDALPFLETKEQSTVTLNAEFAQLVPGTYRVIAGDGASFIDDFENTATPFSLLNPFAWRLASVPREAAFDPTLGAQDDARINDRRSKLAWYQVDNNFYRANTNQFKPPNITDDDLRNHYVRAISPQEIFPGFDLQQGNFFEPVLDLAYYPTERGPYNFNTALNTQGQFTPFTARNHWAGITTAFRFEVDFDKANIEYLELWLLDPFIQTPLGVVKHDSGPGANNNDTSGELIFHLGSVSEDFLRDGRHAFENGLPTDGNANGTTPNAWGVVTSQQYLNNAFTNEPSARPNQDVGLDGINNTNELIQHQDFLNTLNGTVTNSEALALIRNDPAGDNFQYFLGGELDTRNAKILERYKNFNGLENNSPVLTGADPIARSGSVIPDNEDLNQDNTISNTEEYYVYRMRLNRNDLRVGSKFVVDEITTNPELSGEPVKWYLVRIPVRQFDEAVGDINGFKSIRYARMIVRGFENPVVLRMAKFRAVGNRWRRYEASLLDAGFGKPADPNLDNFSVSVVNVEENSQPNENKPGYVEPLQRDRDNTSVVQRRLNEQAVQLCVSDLVDGDARAIYKNVSMDFFNYGRLKMFMSAHVPSDQTIADNELTGFVRVGTDFDQNYYEIELPLQITPNNTRDVNVVWPDQNQIDLDLNELYALKAERDRESFPLGQLFPQAAPRQAGKHALRILGRPDLSQTRLIMIGVRNPRNGDTRAVSVCLWANELRLTDFDLSSGWATNVVLNTKLADLGTVTGSMRYTTFGYGGVQSRISERSRNQTLSYDISGNLNVDKLLPQNTGLKIPMFFSYESTVANPNFDPANADLRIAAALKSFNTESEREAYLRLIQDRSVRRSLNFTNVRKTKVRPNAPTHLYDIENFAFTYAYSEATQTNFNLQENTRRSIRGAVQWQYAPTFTGFEPFKESSGLKSPYLKWLKEFNFNPVPSNLSVRGELDRSFSKLVYRNDNSDAQSSLPNFQKYLVFNRFYTVRWSLTKALTVDYNTRANAIIDEPDTDPEGGFSRLLNRNVSAQQYRDSVLTNLKNFGRMKNFEQAVTANYTLPFEKFPVTNWLQSDYRYNVTYSWRAGPVERTDSLRLGNIIQNAREQGINGRIDMIKLYNKIGFLKNINSPPRKPTVSLTKKPEPDTVKRPADLGGLKGLLRVLMSIRNISGTYSLTEGTILPGFTPSPHLLGLSRGWDAPGWGFVLGDQDPGVRFRARDNNWLTTSSILTTPFTQSQTRDLGLRASVEPTNDLKIQLDLKKTANTTFQEIFRFDADSGRFRSLSPSQSGAYRISILSINTAFRNNGSINSEVFNTFAQNIGIVQQRFNTIQGGGFEGRSQDVLIPAFLAAYTGQSASTVGLSPFPRIPVPNWRVDYNGLNKLKAFKDMFQSVTISHAYTSSYSVMNYSNSLQYENVGVNIPVEDYNRNVFASIPNEQGQLIPIYVISQVMISETFAPLVGINIRTKNRMNLRFDYKTKRDVALNTSNAQITELNAKDWSVEFGYTKTNMKLPFKEQGRTITLKNDVTFRVNVSLTNSRTIQRKIDEVNTITNGNINIQVRPNVSYVVNQKLTIQMYVDRNVNEPLVTNSYRRSTTRVGAKVVFNLAQ